MIRLKRVELKDGTIYKNLYYAITWFDLECAIDDNDEEIIFHQKKDGKYIELPIQTDDIKDILKDDEFEESPIYINEDGSLTNDDTVDLGNFLAAEGFQCVKTFKIPLGNAEEKNAMDIADTYEQIDVVSEDIVRDTFEDLELEQFSQEQVDMVKATIMSLCENEMLYRPELNSETILANAVKATMMVVMFLLDKVGEQKQLDILDLDRTSFLIEFANYIKSDSKISFQGTPPKGDPEEE